MNVHTPPSAPLSRTSRWLRPGASLAAAALLAGCVIAPIGPPRRVVVSPPPASLPAPGVAGAGHAPLYFYPSRAQTEALQDRDRYECYRWAVRETGTDPGMTPLRQAPERLARAPVEPRYGSGTRADAGDVVGGAAVGAFIGAAVSSPRNAGANAVLGAIFGAAVGAAAGEARNRAIDDAERRQEASLYRSRPPQDNFRRAMSACMQGRGYNVQ